MYAQLETGMELHVLFAQILKFGQHQDFPAFVLTATGTVLLVLNVQPIKFGSQQI